MAASDVEADATAIPDVSRDRNRSAPSTMTSMAKPVVVTVGTGWDSSKGGLSTFNRFLSLTLARSARVVCSLEAFDGSHAREALARGVELVAWDDTVSALEGVSVVAVIGHGRITGSKAREISEKLRCPRVHFVHMWAESIESIKRADIETAMSTSFERDEAERELATTSSLVVAVGPRLQRSVANYLADGTKVLSFVPGFATEITSWTPVTAPPPKLVCLVMGRAEPEDIALKGFDIAARAVATLRCEHLLTVPELLIRGLPHGTAQQFKERMEDLRKGSDVPFTYRPFTSDEGEVERDFRQASVVLMPSREEGFGLVGLDAIALGVPCLVSSKTGLGDFLVQAGHKKNVVVRTTGDIEVDAAEWQREIEFTLRDPTAAFRRAAVLRTDLERKLSWAASTESLLAALRDLPKAPAVSAGREQAPVVSPDAIAAALHLRKEMDLETSDETQRMITALVSNGSTDDDEPPMWDVALECASRARKVDSDAATQLEIAVSILRKKYANLEFDPRAEASRLPSGYLHQTFAGTNTELASLFEKGLLVFQDLSSITPRAIDYARAHGFHPHVTAMSGHAANRVAFGKECLAQGRAPDAYDIENLGRLFEAATQFLAIDAGNLGRGYRTDGELHPEAIARADTWLAFARHGAPTVELHVGARDEFSRAASFRAREQDFRHVTISSTSPRVEIVASSWKYVYRWGPDAATPEREWETPDTRKVRRLVAAKENGTSELWIESEDGAGVAYEEATITGRWRSRRPAMALWRDLQGRIVRGALDGDGSLLIQHPGEERTQTLALRDAVRQRLRAFGHDFEDVTAASEIWPGRCRGRPCLVIPCGLEPRGLALVLVDPQTCKLTRAPLIVPFYIEECAMFDAGSTCLLAATIMKDAAGALAIWDLSIDAADSRPTIVGSPTTKGGTLAVASGDRGAEIYFTTHERGAFGFDYTRSTFWRWASSTRLSTRLFDVSGWVTTVAVATNRSPG